MSTEPQSKPRLARFSQAATIHNVAERTIRNYAAKGLFPIYKIKGHRGVFVDLNQVEAAVAKMPRRSGVASPKAYGPRATVIEIGGAES